MRSSRLSRWLTVGALLALPVLASAQEATLSGTVSDTTDGALPGVTVRAVHEASGNSFEAVTDERAEFRLAVRVGAYQVDGRAGGIRAHDADPDAAGWPSLAGRSGPSPRCGLGWRLLGDITFRPSLSKHIAGAEDI